MVAGPSLLKGSFKDFGDRLKTKTTIANDQSIQEAVALLEKGQLVAFPTETVYGLGADATSSEAAARIFEAKERPAFNPLIAHFDGLAMARQYGAFNKDAMSLAEACWPGPLSLVVGKRNDAEHIIDPLVTAGLETIAMRVPEHSIARQLIKAFGKPIAAPSANRSGTMSPTSPAHVLRSLNGKIPLILAGGSSRVGLESTIVDCSGTEPVLLRQGYFTKEMLESILEKEIQIADRVKQNEAPKSPGLLLKHYAPNKPLYMNSENADVNDAQILFGPGLNISKASRAMNLSEEGDLLEAASKLFAYLFEIDADENSKAIHVAPIPDEGIGRAINDRLRRASEN